MKRQSSPASPPESVLQPQSCMDDRFPFSIEQQRQIDGLRETLERLERRYNLQEKFVKKLKSEVQTMRDAITIMGAPLRPAPLDRAARTNTR